MDPCSRPQAYSGWFTATSRVHGATRQSWLVEHRPAASATRAVSLNQLAALELR